MADAQQIVNRFSGVLSQGRPWRLAEIAHALHGTPAPIIARLNAAVLKAVQAPKIVETLAAQGMEVKTSTPEEMRALWVNDSARYKTLLQRTKTTIQ